MKNTFKKAHEMAREIKVEYPEVDYRTQFGICLSYLLNNKEEEKVEFLKKEEVRSFKDGMLTLTTSNRQPAWIAEITGLDKKYGFKREFLEVTVDGGRWVDYLLDNNAVYNWKEGKRQQFGIVENGILYEITKTDVQNMFAQ